MSTQAIPTSVTKYFWGDNLKDLSVDKNQKYIIQTLLENGNEEALHWLFSIYGKKLIKQLLSNLRLSKKSANFWSIYLSR